MRRRTVLTGGLASLLVPAASPATRADAAGSAAGLPDPRALAAAPGRVELERTLTTVAPGLTLERLATLDAAGSQRTSLLRLAPGTGTRPALLQRSLSEPRTPAELATAAGAVAAVNGDFYDIDRTGTPDGPVVVDGHALKADAAVQRAVGVDDTPTGWAGRLGDVRLTGTATVGERTWPLAALATRTVPADAVALFTPAWGPGDRTPTAPGGLEVEVRAGRVSAVRSPGRTPVPADGLVLVATGTVATALAGTAVGTPASTAVDVRVGALDPGSDGFALGARLELVRDGAVAAIDTADPTWAALRARTALGWTRAGELLLLTADGGTARSRGLTAVETAQRMVEAGAAGAVVLDGGGSAQLVARPAGEAHVAVVGEPSDGAPRAVAHAVGLLPPAADGRATGIVWRGPGGRVLPGLLLAVEAAGTDAALAPAPLEAPAFSTDAPATAAVESVEPGDGGTRVLVRGSSPGRTVLRVRAGAASGELALEVLGPLASLELDPSPQLTTAGAVADVQITGRDGEGRRARVDAADVTVTTDPALLSVAALPDGRLRLTAAGTGPAAVPVVLRAGAVSTTTAVAVGLSTVLADPVTDPGRWRAAATRATAALAPVTVDDLAGVRAALRLTHDTHEQPTGTSVAAAVADPPVALPAGTREVALRVRGDGAGGWLRAVLRVDGAARPVTFAERVDFTGWRRLTAAVPAGAREVAVERVYVAQTDAARRTAGRLDLAALEAGTAPAAPGAVDAPRDPALGPGTATGPRTGRVALVAATHVRAAHPGTETPLREALRGAAAAGAQHVLLSGDVVGTPGRAGTDADVALAREVLAQELPAATSWSWLPGDGEAGTAAAAGPASSGAAAPHRRLDLAGTRYVLLDATGGSLRTAGFTQLPWLRAELDAAAADGAVTGVVVVAARGPGSGAGDLVDPDESALLRGWAARWRTATGGRIALVGRADGATPAVTRREGVLEVGAARALAPGGGSGCWTLLTVDAAAPSPPEVAGALPAGADDGWLRVHARPLGQAVVRRGRAAR
ncbi:phosphodiester glycosidase family protein [Kineococcus sp. TRM81007]|uniref:phosphodiester glycosidase family protein n=1 Tax=Kineococcus sp. TRM81007 TaxID=2925831 RepID=UPI00272990ED|nr:phosphodiester glycosidase family protein [Kineococcus sp. TRM81007]